MISTTSTAFDIIFGFLFLAGILSVIPGDVWIKLWSQLSNDENK